MSKRRAQRKPAPSDRHFGDIAQKFKNNIYGTSKGKIREAVLKRDLLEQVSWLGDAPHKRIIDVGGGQGQLALYLAGLGHKVTLVDISQEMLDVAKQQAEVAGVSEKLTFIHAPLQSLEALELGQFDLVLCHAVLEWLVEQDVAIQLLANMLRADGVLSLMYFNKSAQLMANMVYGNFDYVKNGLKVKQKVGLSPNNPVEHTQVMDWAVQANLTCKLKTGVRCFHDYLRDLSKAESDFGNLMELELKFNRQEPYASIGRYTHVMLEPTNN